MSARGAKINNSTLGLIIGGTAVSLAVLTYLYVRETTGKVWKTSSQADTVLPPLHVATFARAARYSQCAGCASLASAHDTSSVVQSGFAEDRALPPSAAIRGQYINSSAKDIGPDFSENNPYIRYRRAKAQEAQLREDAQKSDS